MSSAMESLYQQLILDHARTPSHRGITHDDGVEVHHVNPTCGDEVTLRLLITGDDGDARVGRLEWDGQGCSISQASISMMADLLDGQDVATALDLGDRFRAMMDDRGREPDGDELGDAVALHGVAQYPARIKCALLGWMAFKDALGRSGVSTGSAEDEGEDAP